MENVPSEGQNFKFTFQRVKRSELEGKGETSKQKGYEGINFP
jgi:hypothetical protein